MSHNKIKVGGQSPNTSGEISVALDNLSSVNLGTPSTDDVLQWSGSEWITGTAPAGAESYILLGQGETAAYSTSGATSITALNTAIHLYDTNPLNTISGATINAVPAVSDWYDDITLPAGTYNVLSQVRVEFSANGYLGFAVLNASSNAQLSSKAAIGINAGNVAEGVSTTINSILTISSQTRVKLAIFNDQSNVDSIANQGDLISEFSYLFIRKVS